MTKVKEIQKKVGSLFCVGIEGETLTQEEKIFLLTYNVGGVILFQKNLSSVKQIYDLCLEIQRLRFSFDEKMPLFIGVDMEGGRVHRLKTPFTIWPALSCLGERKNSQLAFDWAYSMGCELKAVGFNLNFAPCLDVLTNQENTVIGDRALSSQPEEVSALAPFLIEGYQKAGIIACAKHFPGHGHTTMDSHEDLPEEKTSLKTLCQRGLLPFQKVLEEDSQLSMLMTAHIKFFNIDSKWPVTLSSFFLKELLRKKMKYKNLIISDDLEMKAMTSHYEHSLIPKQALKSGCDLLLYRSRSKAQEALNSVVQAVLEKDLKEEDILESWNRVQKIKKKKIQKIKPSFSFDEAMKVIGCKKHQDLLKQIQTFSRTTLEG